MSADQVYILLTLAVMAALFYVTFYFSSVQGYGGPLSMRTRVVRTVLEAGLPYLVAGIVVRYMFPGGVGDAMDYLHHLGDLFAGWIGLLLGSTLRRDTIGTIRPALFLKSARHSVMLIGITTGLFALLYNYYPQLFPPHAPTAADPGLKTWQFLLGLGLLAAMSSPFFVGSLQRRFKVTGEQLVLAKHISALEFVWVIIGVGLVYADTRRPAWWVNNDWETVNNFVLALLAGMTLGVFFRIMTRFTRHNNERFLLMSGMILFTTGLSLYLHQSPLFVNAVAGFVFVQSGQSADWLERQLGMTELPFYHIMLFLLGLMWPGFQLPVIFLALIYLNVRLVVLMPVSMMSTGSPKIGPALRLSRFLTPQDGLIVAFVFSMWPVAGPGQREVFVAAAALAIIFYTALSYSRISSLLNWSRT